MTWVAAAVASASATFGAYQYFHAKHQAKKNIRPTYAIDPSYEASLKQLENTIGLPHAALEMYYRNNGQNQSAAYNSLLFSGGNPNQIASIYGTGQQGNEQIMVQDMLQRKQDLANIIAARTALADQKDKGWQLNALDPYKDRALALAAEKSAGLKNIENGVNTVASAFASRATSKLADSMNKMNLNTNGIKTPNSGVNTNAMSAWMSNYLQQNQAPQLNLNIQTPQQQPNYQGYPYFYNPYSPFNPSQQLYFGQ